MEIKICIWCLKVVPNHRQERAQTCSKPCSHDWNHASGNQRNERRKLWIRKTKHVNKNGNRNKRI